MDKKNFPKTIGEKIKKEILIDSFLENPKKIAVLIVIPDLEIPGKIDIHCAIPIMKNL
nr:hypothetical protein [bacterium endosymbiont of Pedicinus badii]